MEQISVRVSECRKLDPSGGGPVVVGDRVQYGDRLWRVVGIYVVHDPTSGRSEEYCVLSRWNDGVSSEAKRG